MQFFRDSIVACLALFIVCSFTIKAQSINSSNRAAINTHAQRLAAHIDSFNTAVPREKIFVQTDRPSYSNTDTIWLKAYILDAALNYSRQSGLLYTELINDTGKVVLRQSMPVKLGISFGQMILDDNNMMPEGSYTLRAYTNWMQNQGLASFFIQRLYISAANNNTWLVNENHRLVKNNGFDNVRAALQLTKLNHTNVVLQELQLKVMDGDKIWQRDNVKTDIEGKLNLNFNLPDSKTSDLRFVIETGKKDSTHRLIVPISIDRAKNIDLQFMPEGGQLAAGLTSHIGFKAIAEDGHGVNIEGNVLDSKGNIAATFRSSRLGMGSFLFTPQPSEKYTAIITSPQANGIHYSFPQVQLQGIVLHVNNPADKDSVYITIRATDAIAKTDSGYTLIAKSGGKVCYAANLSLADGIVHGAVNKSRLQEGIVHFVVFNNSRQPVVERLIFVNCRNALNISITPDRKAYQPKDSVALQVKVTDKANKPVQGSFSLAVTDNELVRSNKNMPDIRTAMLLTSDLKGEIEEPNYYFDPKNTDRYEALDNLLLTQGWVGYSWQDVFNLNYKPSFKAEPEIVVTGHISRTGNKDISGLQVVLFSPKKPMLMLNQLTDKNGRFEFNNLPRIDTGNFLVQVHDKKGKLFEATLDLDVFKPANTQSMNNTLLHPWYINTDSTLLNYAKSSLEYNKIAYKLKLPTGTRMLKEVKVNARKTIKGSHFYAGAGAVPDVVMDENDMRAANKLTVEELLAHKIKGFSSRPYPCDKMPTSLEYTVGCNWIIFSIDGFYVDEFYYPHPGYTDHYEYIKSFIGTLTAEDVRGIEEKDKHQDGYTYSIIEITTWSGSGAFTKRIPGRYLYRPMPITWPKQFYKPRYTAKINNPLADLCPTVLWEPNIITDTAGKATVWFYTKSKSTNYTGIINGSDLNGSVGSATFTIQSK